MPAIPNAMRGLGDFLQANTGMVLLTICGGVNPMDGSIVTAW